MFELKKKLREHLDLQHLFIFIFSGKKVFFLYSVFIDFKYILNNYLYYTYHFIHYTYIKLLYVYIYLFLLVLADTPYDTINTDTGPDFF